MRNFRIVLAITAIFLLAAMVVQAQTAPAPAVSEKDVTFVDNYAGEGATDKPIKGYFWALWKAGKPEIWCFGDSKRSDISPVLIKEMIAHLNAHRPLTDADKANAEFAKRPFTSFLIVMGKRAAASTLKSTDLTDASAAKAAAEEKASLEAQIKLRKEQLAAAKRVDEIAKGLTARKTTASKITKRVIRRTAPLAKAPTRQALPQRESPAAGELKECRASIGVLNQALEKEKGLVSWYVPKFKSAWDEKEMTKIELGKTKAKLEEVKKSGYSLNELFFWVLMAAITGGVVGAWLNRGKNSSTRPQNPILQT